MIKNDSYDAPFWGLPNGENPEPRSPIFYGSTKVPHPTNSAAKIVDHAKVMKQVLDGK
jgi:hypothetical protein